MSEIITRYGCDSCGRYFEKEDDLQLVEVKFLRKDDKYRDSVAFDVRRALICEFCMSKNDSASKPKITNITATTWDEV